MFSHVVVGSNDTEASKRLGVETAKASNVSALGRSVVTRLIVVALSRQTLRR